MAADEMSGDAVSTEINLGLHKLLVAAASVPIWEYAVLVMIVTWIFVYHILNCHILGDILRGWPGDSIDLYYDPKSPVSAQLLTKCEVMRRKFWPTPWLCSPHLQTLYLHLFGNGPRLEYQRQLYVTSDAGTIALDWVMSPTLAEDGSGEERRRNPALDEIPTAIIVPGLTSDSNSHYVRHIAGSLAEKDWRVVIANHRGLGGVSITSDQFYNAGWTEDLRKIIQLVKDKYPKSPLLAVGLSIGANILVKYLGEEGPRTPLGGGVAICCPWDLVVCDRFMSRMGIQWLYNKAMATGLQQYAKLHRTALSRITDWNVLSKSASIRDFDRNCTRLVGNFETVDTYYRKCSSAQFLGAISVPLLCISAEDDPICTKEAIPYDECRVNPHVILGVSSHGGHLAYFEGLRGTSIWWVRAATEFAWALLSSSLMHQQSRAGVGHRPSLGSNVDKSPFLTMTDDFELAAKDSGGDGGFMSTARESQVQFSGQAQENGWANHVADHDFGNRIERPVIQDAQTDGSRDIVTEEISSRSTDSRVPGHSFTHIQVDSQPSMRLKLQSSAEVSALRSALSQLLDQLPVSSSAREDRSQNASESVPESQIVEVPINPSVVAGFGNCVNATKDLLQSNDAERKSPTKSLKGHLHKAPIQSKGDLPELSIPFKHLAGLASQNRRTLWLLTYVALVTTFPLLGPAFLVHTRGRVLDILFYRWFKRTP